MLRKVLLAEQVDATRTVAEAILRQHGFEVIAVTAAEKAREVMELTKPDLIIIGADLLSPDGIPYYSRLREDSKLAAIPMLLFESSDPSAVNAPPESVIPRPFDPQDFMQRVSQAVSGPVASGSGDSTPLHSTDVDDDFLDAALGLDQIDVTDSEVMDQTPSGTGRKSRKKLGEKLIGYETGTNLNDSDTNIPAVESLILEEDASRIQPRTPKRTEPPTEGTGKLDILFDQFGMSAEAERNQSHGDGPHGYDWFVDAVREDVRGEPTKGPAHGESGKLHITENSSAVSPVTPGPSALSKPKQTGSVEEFIDEFKREMELLHFDEGETAIAQQTLTEVKPPPSKEASLDWEDKAEQIGPAQVDLFTQEFARHLADKVATMIAAKIDPEKLLNLIRNEFGEWKKNR